MTNIKIYKPKLVIELKDWTKLYSDAKIKDFVNYLNSDKVSFIQIWDTVINKFEIKKAYMEKINWVEDYILSLPKDVLKIVRDREKKMMDKVWKRFKTIEQVKRYLLSKNLIK